MAQQYNSDGNAVSYGRSLNIPQKARPNAQLFHPIKLEELIFYSGRLIGVYFMLQCLKVMHLILDMSRTKRV